MKLPELKAAAFVLAVMNFGSAKGAVFASRYPDMAAESAALSLFLTVALLSYTYFR